MHCRLELEVKRRRGPLFKRLMVLMQQCVPIVSRRVCVCVCATALCMCVSLWPPLVPAAFSYSCTVISCWAEIEAIYEPKRQKQTNDGVNGADFSENGAPSLYLLPLPTATALSTYKWLLSIFPIFISPEAQGLFLPEINGFPLRAVTRIKSGSASPHFSSHKLSDCVSVCGTYGVCLRGSRVSCV